MNSKTEASLAQTGTNLLKHRDEVEHLQVKAHCQISLQIEIIPTTIIMTISLRYTPREISNLVYPIRRVNLPFFQAFSGKKEINGQIKVQSSPGLGSRIEIASKKF